MIYVSESSDIAVNVTFCTVFNEHTCFGIGTTLSRCALANLVIITARTSSMVGTLPVMVTGRSSSMQWKSHVVSCLSVMFVDIAIRIDGGVRLRVDLLHG